MRSGFQIDPKEELVAVFMAQLHPTGDLNISQIFKALAYQAIID